MAIIAISRQVAALGDEIATAVAEKLGYKFITRKEIEKRIVDLGVPEEKLKKYLNFLVYYNIYLYLCNVNLNIKDASMVE